MSKIIPQGAPVMEVTAVPVFQPSSYKHRLILNRKNGNTLGIVHDVPPSKFTDGCMQKCGKVICPCCYMSCKCCDPCKDAKAQLRESTYTWVMENRIEYNRPFLVPGNGCCSVCMCRFQVEDSINVVYFDSHSVDQVRTDNPPCHACKTWCCGSAGETVALRGPFMCCPGKLLSCTVVAISVTEGTANKVAVKISDARDSARARMSVT